MWLDHISSATTATKLHMLRHPKEKKMGKKGEMQGFYLIIIFDFLA